MQLQITTDKFHLIRHYQCGTSKLYQCDTFRPILHNQYTNIIPVSILGLCQSYHSLTMKN